MACFIWCTNRETTVADRLGAGELRPVDDALRELRLEAGTLFETAKMCSFGLGGMRSS